MLRLGLAIALAVTSLLLGEAAALTYEEARHLVSRTGFGANPVEVKRLLPLDRTKAVDLLLGEVGAVAGTPPPAWVHDKKPGYWDQANWTAEQRNAFTQVRRSEVRQLKAWWLTEMVVTPTPLTERMVLFWHNHFTSGFEGINWSHMLYDQNAMFREHALGSYRSLVGRVIRDPMMLRYLDNVNNRRGRPNENFARELLELFTLGEGNYTEGDIREVARAFSGWTLDRAKNYTFLVSTGQHDAGQKTVLGKTGRFDGQSVVDIILERDEAARLVVTKLWREFVSDMPEEREVARLAKVFRDSGLQLKPLLRAMLVSDAFWADANRTTLIKSPIDVVVGTIRTFDLPIADLDSLPQMTKRLGQDVFDPPNVKGWPGGTLWITPHTLLVRRQTIDRLVGWQTVSIDMSAGMALPEDQRLRVRLAAENCRGGPRIVVKADGATIADTTLTFGHDSEALGRPGDPAELERRMIELPLKSPRTAVQKISIDFVNDSALRSDGVLVCDRNLYVDWIELGDRLLAAADAEQVDRCPNRPRPGNMFCSGTLTFDLAKPVKTASDSEMSMGMAMDDGMAMKARAAWERVLAGRRTTRSFDDWLAALPSGLGQPAGVWRSLGPAAPMVFELGSSGAEAVRSFLDDLSYQLR